MSAASNGLPESRRQTAAIVSLVTAAIYGAGWLVYATAAPEWLIGAVSAGATAAVVSPVLVRCGAGLAAGYTLACAAAAGCWLALAARTSPAMLLVIGVLAVAAVVLGALYPLVCRHQQYLAEQARRRAEEERRKAAERKWPDLLARLGHPGISFRGQTETRSGHTIRLGLPANGKVIYGTLAEATERIEIASRLRHGAVRLERGGRADEVFLHVSERDVLAETVPLPDTTRPLTVNEPLPIGLHEVQRCRDLHDRPQGRADSAAVAETMAGKARRSPGHRLAGHDEGRGRTDAARCAARYRCPGPFGCGR